MRIVIIAAVAENRVIGRDGELPWHLPDDLKRFKSRSMGRAVIMGRRTWESLGGPLPGRRAIVVTRDRDYEAPGASVAHSLEAAIDLARSWGEPEVLILGGAAIYAEALPRADRLELTEVHARPEGDTRFPPFDSGPWKLVEQQHHPADDRHACPFTFRTYERQPGLLMKRPAS